MLSLDILNNTDQKIEKSSIKEVLDRCFSFAEENKMISAGTEMELSVALVDKDEIRMHNRRYREKDQPTDVLSFCYEKTKDFLSGELILCPEIIEENAKEDGIEFQYEFKKNLIHGFLHIIGYEHGDEMFEMQDRILGSTNYK